MENIIDRKKSNAAYVIMWLPTFQNVTIDWVPMNPAWSIPNVVRVVMKNKPIFYIKVVADV